MSTFVDIERALAQCGPGQFEKVIGAILDARGIRGLTLLGSVVGKDKTRSGVPDAYASVDGRSFVFAACTTETGSSQVERKLFDDVAQCADTDKTGVPIEAIDVLYLAFNSTLPPEALTRVAAFAEEKGLKVNFLSVSEIAGDLSRRYTWIAKDFFGIQVDTGQVLSVDAFVRAYDQGLLATPLETRFLFRDADLADAIERCGKADLVIKGGPGTGKTRFAIELVRSLAAQGLHIRCVLSSEQPIVQEIDRHFSEAGQYVVLLDDANRVNGLDHVVRAIRDRVDARSVRFIFTVRNYALPEVRAALTALRSAPEELELSAFTHEETEAFLEQSFEVRNRDFQQQVWRLSKGNARLATMAAKLALETRDFSAITDLTRLYEAYYRLPIKIADSSDSILTPVLALLSVLRSLRNDAAEMIAALEQAFGWRDGSLWPAVLELHRLECVDVHRNRVARVCDQILASYAFFLVFVERRSLSFRTLVDELGVSRLGRVRDVLFDIQSTMDQQRVRDALEDDVKALLRGASGQFQLELLQAFWYFDPDFTLGIVEQHIQALEPPKVSSKFDEGARFDMFNVLVVLARFSDDGVRRSSAVDLALRFLAKQPSHGGAVLALLTEMDGFGIHRYSDRDEFQTQKDVAHALRSAPLDAELARKLLIRYATKMLRTEFEGSFSEGMRITLHRIRLTPEKSSPAYRAVLWEGLLECVTYPEYTGSLNALLRDYAGQSRGDTDAALVLAEDMPWVKRLFFAIASADRPADGALATALNHRYLSVGLEGFTDVVAVFKTEVNQLALLVAPNWEKMAEDEDVEQEERRSLLILDYADRDAPAVVNLFLSVAELRGADSHDVLNAWQFLLNYWAERDPDKLLAVTELALRERMVTVFNQYGWVGSLLRGCGKKATSTIIAAAPAEVRERWEQAFLTLLPANEITPADVEEYLLVLGRPGTIPPWIRDVQNYIQAAPRFLSRLIEVLLYREDGAASLTRLLPFSAQTEIDLLREQLRDEPELLARAYLKAAIEAPSHSHFDHNAALFDLLLDLRHGFFDEYVQARVRKERWIYRASEGHRDYGRLWKRPDWGSRLVELLQALPTEGVHASGDYLRAWLPVRGEHGPLSAEAMDHLKAVIHQHAEHVGLMQAVFSGVSDLEHDQRLDLWSSFLARNQNLDAFKALPLLPNHWSATGSAVPVLQARVRFLERLANLMTTPAFIGHRMHVSEEILGEQSRVDAEIENDFVGYD